MHTLDLSQLHSAPNLETFTFGTARSPSGVEIAADGVSLLEAGRRMTPVMGEMHYTRYPPQEWREALLKMKAGGIDIVASYVFWLHHEEVEGEWNWGGDRDLRAFVDCCGDTGLKCIIRCGPWCHGEVRNGGIPDWVLDKGWEVRTDDPRYLEAAHKLYAEISKQLQGLLWKDGGPVIGIQIENEYGGHPDHLLTLKRLAIEAGLDVPLYTRTGWPELQAPMPFGELLPLFGGYAEGFWDRELQSMPGQYWKEFIFKRVRSDAAIASEHFGVREVEDAPDVQRYPYLTCEIGPGMMCSYHRRITVLPMDVVSMVIVKLGSGSNSPGYYMYHGGTNPAGREPWLQEHQATRITNYNDLPVKSYDFQTCLGEFGQVRPQYHLLRPLHMFLQQFGEALAPMASVLPSAVAAKDDTQTLRWAVRTDGRSGFVFVNNYHRMQSMPGRPEVQLALQFKDGQLILPPTDIPADSAFFWPFNFDLGDGLTLRYATAQPLTQLCDGNVVYTLFLATGPSAEFAFTGEDSPTRHRPAGTTPVITRTADNGTVHRILLLDGETASTCYRGTVADRDRIVLSPAPVVFDGEQLRLSTEIATDITLSLLPAPATVRINDHVQSGTEDGVFTRYTVPGRHLTPVQASAQLIKEAGPARAVRLGGKGVAMQPADADFEAAAVWQITLPADTDARRKLLLRVHYTGDVARAYLGETLLTDNFYNGTPFEIGLGRYGPDVLHYGITLKVLPLRQDAPIHMHSSVRPDFQGQPAAVALHGVEIIESHDRTLLLT